MKLLNFNILKLTLFLGVGIITAHFVVIPVGISLKLTFALLVLLTIAYIVSKNQIKKTIWFGLIAFVATISLGILVYDFHNQKNFKLHYSSYISDGNPSKNLITFRIHERLKPSNFYNKYIVDILKINDKTVNGKSLLNVAIDSTVASYKVDDVFITSSTFEEL